MRAFAAAAATRPRGGGRRRDGETPNEYNEPPVDAARATARYPGVSTSAAVLLEILRWLMGDQNVDEANSGLLAQYREGYVDEARLEEIVVRQRRLLKLIMEGRFTP